MGIGRGILAIWHGVRPERVDDTLSWYDREHHLERLRVPGFRNVRRYHAVEADPSLFIRYETDSPSVLTSPDYLARLNHPTAWTKQAQPGFLDNIRSVCVRDAQSGWAEGGFVVTVRKTSASGGRVIPMEVWADASARVLALAGIVGTEFWRADLTSSTVRTDEKRLRGREDGYVDWAALAHATNLSDARHARSALLDGGLGDRGELIVGIYALAAASYHNMD